MDISALKKSVILKGISISTTWEGFKSIKLNKKSLFYCKVYKSYLPKSRILFTEANRNKIFSLNVPFNLNSL